MAHFLENVAAILRHHAKFLRTRIIPVPIYYADILRLVIT